MTNQQGAPEALRTIAEWPITDPDNMDAVNMAAVARAALVEAQQPAITASQPVVPAGWKLVPVEPTEEIISAAQGGAILDDRMSGLFRQGLLGNWSDMLAAAPAQPAAVPAPSAAPAVGEMAAGHVIDLIGKLVQAESNKTRTHQEYMGKAMPDDVYAHFQRLRDETIPALRTQLLDALATSPKPSPAHQADSQPAPVDDFPAGAIINGRALAERLESGYTFECEAGPLRMCSDWQEFVRCFDYLATWVENRAARAPADSQPAGVTVDDAIRIAKSIGVREYGPNTRNWSFEYSQLAQFVALLTAAAYVDADRAARAPADSQPAKTERFNPMEGGDPETALQMAAVIAFRDSAQAAATLPDPHGCNACKHPDCGKFDGPRSVECRAMAVNACARHDTANQAADSVPSSFGSPELQAMILARCVEKDRADSVLEDAAPNKCSINRYCHANMCLETDADHEPDCPQGHAARKQGGAT